MGLQSRMKALRRRESVDGMRPSFEAKAPLSLRPRDWPAGARDRYLIDGVNDVADLFALGECSVIRTREYGRWHLSIAHPDRYPTWDEIAEARYRLMPDDVVVAMILPPRSEYVNLHKGCFHLWEVNDSVPGEWGDAASSRGSGGSPPA